MKHSHQMRLRSELRAAGAGDAELKALLPIAANLELLQDASPARPSNRRNWSKFAKPAGFTLSGLAAGMLLVIVSQSVLPTSPLYPVQKLSDNLAAAVQPSYRADVMMKRAHQVHELVAQRAGSGAVLAALADYTSAAGAYKAAPHTSYAAFDYCESNLEQAASIAPPGEKRAITQSLHSLQAT